MPIITNENYNDLWKFIKDNLEEFNQNDKPFEFNNIKKAYTSKGYLETEVISATMIRKALSERYAAIINDTIEKAKLENKLKALKATTVKAAKLELKAIALEYLLSFKQVEGHYKRMIQKAVMAGFEREQSEWRRDTISRLLKYADSISQVPGSLPGKYVKSDYKTCVAQLEYWLINLGFSQNLTNEIKGQDVANQGDSAQFFFVGRAMMAGFNCSNVDVRSSPYDAIISKPNSNGKAFNLKTVQVKGITSGKSLPLKKRARGGSGSDSTTGRNIATLLSPDDADLLVAVDKQFGTCYIIPMDDVKERINDGNVSISWQDLEKLYKEKWDKI